MEAEKGVGRGEMGGERGCCFYSSSAQGRMDKELVLWLNSQEFPSALLCSDVTDLRSGMLTSAQPSAILIIRLLTFHFSY